MSNDAMLAVSFMFIGIAIVAGCLIGAAEARKSIAEDCIRVGQFHQSLAGQEFRVFKCELQK